MKTKLRDVMEVWVAETVHSSLDTYASAVWVHNYLVVSVDRKLLSLLEPLALAYCRMRMPISQDLRGKGSSDCSRRKSLKYRRSDEKRCRVFERLASMWSLHSAVFCFLAD